uniref:Alpha-macroglobulin receptor-binding domain-containing protein n=1 Tax=Acanthochromis polyacanthus TaxID=80966 RepID=A0A3Q1G1Q6_9TELE
MIHMTLPVIATLYLDKTNQWETVGFLKRNEALQHIRTGYKNELAYRKKDGSFAVWASRASSTWLTAYVVKVFSMANGLVAVQNEVICDAVKFLILNAQQPDGMFKEVGRVSHGEMIVNIIFSFFFSFLCVQSLPNSVDKAVGYLEKRLPHLTNPYAVAMASYALANEKKLNRDILKKHIAKELNHWRSPRGHVYTMEATAYGLLALVKAKATIMVYQAVAEYWTAAKEPEYDLNVDVLLPGRSQPDKFNFNANNHYATRTSKINDINQDVKVTASGTGEATMVSLYYARAAEKESDCQKFNMSVELIPGNLVASVFLYLFVVISARDATMSILDIGLLTGFTVNTEDLKSLSKGRARTIAKYEMDKALSERGSLIIYLDKVSHTRPEEVAFRIHQTLKVGVLQPAAVSVYE